MLDPTNVPDLDRFGPDQAWWLGSALVERCRADGLAVTISIRIGRQRVFHVALPGTSTDNDGWVDRKAAAVAHFGLSSAAVYDRYVKDNPHFFTAFALSPTEYAPYPGAAPIIVRGTMIGTVAVSGLSGEQDHDLVIEALRDEAIFQAEARDRSGNRSADQGNPAAKETPPQEESPPQDEQPDLSVSFRTLGIGQSAQVWVGGPDLAAPQLLFETDRVLIEAPNWSSDGNTLYVNGDGLLWAIDVRQTAPALRELPFTDLPLINNDHVLSPDGGHIYLSAMDGHIYRGAVTGGAVDRLTPDDGAWHFLHGVSPEHDRLAYVQLTDFTSPGRLAVMRLSPAGASAEVLDTGPGHLDGPEWSPDGTHLYVNTEAFTNSPGHAQLARLPDGGGILERLVDSTTVDWFPHLSPDGRHATYLSFPSGTLGHPADLDVEVKLVATSDWATPIRTYPIFGGQGTLNVNSWAPDGERFAFIAYPISN